MLLNCFDVIPLTGRPRNDRRFARRGRDFHRNRVGEIITARFADRIKRVLKLVLLNRHAFFLRFFELIEDALCLVEFFRLAFKFHPTFASCDFDAEGIFHALEQLQIVRVKRLHLARIVEVQRSRFSHRELYACKPERSTITRGAINGIRKPMPSASVPRAILRQRQ